MPFFARKRLLLAKLETVYGTDSAPTGANALLIKNLQRSIYEGNRVSRELIRPYMGGEESINTGPFVTVSFDVELAGGTAEGVAPALGVLLQACGMTETVVADASVTYTPANTAFKSVTLHYNYDGEIQKIAGARGTARLSMTREQIPIVSFTFTGKYARPTAEALATPVFSPIKAQPFNTANTSVFSVHDQAVFGDSFSLDLACTVVPRNLIGSNTIEITDRRPTGNVVFEAIAVGTKNFFQAAESHQSVVLDGIQIVHGSGDGKVCTITVPNAQLSTIADQESDGIRMTGIDFMPIPGDGGGDEFTIAFT